MKELERLFPTEIGEHLPDGARLRKSAVVKVPRSVYAAVPGRNKFRPSQATPVRNFTLAGDWTSQKFLGSMEGAHIILHTYIYILIVYDMTYLVYNIYYMTKTIYVLFLAVSFQSDFIEGLLITLKGAILAGKLAAKVVADRSKGVGSEAGLGEAFSTLFALNETI